jgi:hypothetical protein
MAYKNQRKAKIALKSATLRHDVLSIAREASVAPAASFLPVIHQKPKANDLSKFPEEAKFERTFRIASCNSQEYRLRAILEVEVHGRS